MDQFSDKFHEECGVFGIYNNDSLDVAHLTYYALYALQHRGQESAGIAVDNSGIITCHKDMGLVNDVFTQSKLNELKGNVAIGHVRYSTTGGSLRENAQPVVVKYKNGHLALAHNGNLVNATKIRQQLENSGVVFQSTIDSEIVLNLVAKHRIKTSNLDDAILEMLSEIQGSYSMVILTSKRLIAIRDALGMRPLCIGQIGKSFVVASETCALDAVGATFLRDVLPGEMVSIDETGLRSLRFSNLEESKLCIFEHVYFARPDSVIDGVSVHQWRIDAGKTLSKEHPAHADLVIGVPDSGLAAALGFSAASGIPYGEGLIKNRYVGRTFIHPDQSERERFIKIKLSPLKNAINGKRLVLVDDSIVRGTTSKRIVQILRDAGAKEVHLRVASPPVKCPCYFGIDTPYYDQLIAANQQIHEIEKNIGVDSLGYLSIEGMKTAAKDSKCGFCTACFDGDYPIQIPKSCKCYKVKGGRKLC